MSDWLSASQAAKKVKLTRWAITKAIRDKRLPATRVGTFWIIDKDDLKRWREWEACR